MGFKILFISILLYSTLDIAIGKDTIHTVVAESFYERSRGLMFRTSLSPDSGMFFVFDKPETLYFWMKNTLIPLDIAFIDSNFVIVDIKHGVSNDTTIIQSTKPCMYALEVNFGYFKKHGIKIGDTIRIIK